MGGLFSSLREVDISIVTADHGMASFIAVCPRLLHVAPPWRHDQRAQREFCRPHGNEVDLCSIRGFAEELLFRVGHKSFHTNSHECLHRLWMKDNLVG